MGLIFGQRSNYAGGGGIYGGLMSSIISNPEFSPNPMQASLDESEAFKRWNEIRGMGDMTITERQGLPSNTIGGGAIPHIPDTVPSLTSPKKGLGVNQYMGIAADAVSFGVDAVDAFKFKSDYKFGGQDLSGEDFQYSVGDEYREAGAIGEGISSGKQALETGLSGLKAGAKIGSVFGPLGTAIGAGAGALVGGIIGKIGGDRQKKKAARMRRRELARVAKAQQNFNEANIGRDENRQSRIIAINSLYS